MGTQGHLFVTHGDLTRLAADDFIVPCDGRQNVTRGFADLIGAYSAGDGSWLRPLRTTQVRAATGFWRAPDAGRHGERVWLLDTTAKADGVAGLARRLTDALAVIGRETATPLNGRARRLIGLPLVGVGDGGYADRHGETLRALLRALLDSRTAAGAPMLRSCCVTDRTTPSSRSGVARLGSRGRSAAPSRDSLLRSVTTGWSSFLGPG
jgi:hypothetical protein